MPPIRRKTSSQSQSQSQSQQTLSFGKSSKVTKPTTKDKDQDLAKTKPKPSTKPVTSVTKPTSTTDDVDVDVDVNNVPTTTPTPKSASPVSTEEVDEKEKEKETHIATRAVEDQATKEIQQGPLLLSEEERRRAEAVSERDLRRYWDVEEAGRRAPRVHQEGVSLEEKILRHFDLCSQYGPCIGIARITRWRRANMLNLNPPIEVLAVLLKNKEGGVSQRAYMDELMS